MSTSLSPPVNLASESLGAKIVDFSSEIKNCKAANVLHNDLARLWLTEPEEGLPQWICISLRDLVDKTDVVVRSLGWQCWHPYSTNPRTVTVHVSTDGSKFKVWDTFTAAQYKGTQLFCCAPISIDIYPFIAFEVTQTFGGLQTYMNRVYVYTEEVMASSDNSRISASFTRTGHGHIDRISMSLDSKSVMSDDERMQATDFVRFMDAKMHGTHEEALDRIQSQSQRGRLDPRPASTNNAMYSHNRGISLVDGYDDDGDDVSAGSLASHNGIYMNTSNVNGRSLTVLASASTNTNTVAAQTSPLQTSSASTRLVDANVSLEAFLGIADGAGKLEQVHEKGQEHSHNPDPDFEQMSTRSRHHDVDIGLADLTAVVTDAIHRNSEEVLGRIKGVEGQLDALSKQGGSLVSSYQEHLENAMARIAAAVPVMPVPLPVGPSESQIQSQIYSTSDRKQELEQKPEHASSAPCLAGVARRLPLLPRSPLPLPVPPTDPRQQLQVSPPLPQLTSATDNDHDIINQASATSLQVPLPPMSIPLTDSGSEERIMRAVDGVETLVKAVLQQVTHVTHTTPESQPLVECGHGLNWGHQDGARATVPKGSSESDYWLSHTQAQRKEIAVKSGLQSSHGASSTIRSLNHRNDVFAAPASPYQKGYESDACSDVDIPVDLGADRVRRLQAIKSYSKHHVESNSDSAKAATLATQSASRGTRTQAAYYQDEDVDEDLGQNLKRSPNSEYSRQTHRKNHDPPSASRVIHGFDENGDGYNHEKADVQDDAYCDDASGSDDTNILALRNAYLGRNKLLPTGPTQTQSQAWMAPAAAVAAQSAAIHNLKPKQSPYSPSRPSISHSMAEMHVKRYREIPIPSQVSPNSYVEASSDSQHVNHRLYKYDLSPILNRQACLLAMLVEEDLSLQSDISIAVELESYPELSEDMIFTAKMVHAKLIEQEAKKKNLEIIRKQEAELEDRIAYLRRRSKEIRAIHH